MTGRYLSIILLSSKWFQIILALKFFLEFVANLWPWRSSTHMLQISPCFPCHILWRYISRMWHAAFLWGCNKLKVKGSGQETPARTSLRSCGKMQLLSWLRLWEDTKAYSINSNCILKSHPSPPQSPNAMYVLWEESATTSAKWEFKC